MEDGLGKDTSPQHHKQVTDNKGKGGNERKPRTEDCYWSGALPPCDLRPEAALSNSSRHLRRFIVILPQSPWREFLPGKAFSPHLRDLCLLLFLEPAHKGGDIRVRNDHFVVQFAETVELGLGGVEEGWNQGELGTGEAVG